MPWPWKLARACFDLSTGQVRQYPTAGAYRENEYLIDAMNIVWRTWVLFSKPMTKVVGGDTVNNWTPADIDFYDWLNKNA
jgi:hypothetical protein